MPLFGSEIFKKMLLQMTSVSLQPVPSLLVFHKFDSTQVS
jgi:hypothetical protein